MEELEKKRENKERRKSESQGKVTNEEQQEVQSALWRKGGIKVLGTSLHKSVCTKVFNIFRKTLDSRDVIKVS